MIDRHEYTQSHLYGYCDCPKPDTGTSAADIARADAKADREIDEHDGLPPESPYRPATRKMSDAEITRRRRARRRF